MLLTHPFPRESRMDIHKNAPLTPLSRAELVRRVLEQRQTRKAVAELAKLLPSSAQTLLAPYSSGMRAKLLAHLISPLASNSASTRSGSWRNSCRQP